MALFRRTKKESVLPEVDKYYDGERRDRAGLAWLLALVSVIIVTLVIIGIFWAGRWAYRSITDNDETAVVDNSGSQTAPSFDGSSEPDGEPESQDAADDDSEDSQNGSDAETLPGSEDQSSEGAVDAPARTDTPSTPTQPTVPATGDDPLPSTGPANIVGVFAGVSTLAGGLHYTVSRRRITRD